MRLLCWLFGCCDHVEPTYVEIVARSAPEGEEGALNILGPDGRNYALYYRTDEEGIYEPVYLVDNTEEDL